MYNRVQRFSQLDEIHQQKMPSNILKTFVGRAFQLVGSFLANSHSTSSNIYSYMYSMTPDFCSFLACRYSGFTGFCADFGSMGVIEGGPSRESYLPNIFAS